VRKKPAGEGLGSREGLQPHLLRGDEIERLRQIESLNVFLSVSPSSLEKLEE